MVGYPAFPFGVDTFLLLNSVVCPYVHGILFSKVFFFFSPLLYLHCVSHASVVTNIYCYSQLKEKKKMTNEIRLVFVQCCFKN